MGTIFGFTQPDAYRGACVSIGNFDGVHLGHQQILAELVRRSSALAAPAVVLTFDPHPVTLLSPGRLPPALTTLDHKAELIGRVGVDTVLVIPTTNELLNLTAREFFERVLIGEMQIRGIVEGTNFCFGKGRQGTVATLRELCEERGLACHIVDPVQAGNATVSSSAIRHLLRAGDVAGASTMLGRPHRAAGIVVTGAQRGRTIGFPTANIEQVETMLPAHGVYAAWCRVAAGTYPAAVNLGPNPTFAEHADKFEAHLLDFSGDLYGSGIEVHFVDRLRDVMTFGSRAQLEAQLRQDVERTREMLTSRSRLPDGT